jgi:hypothetical protein
VPYETPFTNRLTVSVSVHFTRGRYNSKSPYHQLLIPTCVNNDSVDFYTLIQIVGQLHLQFSFVSPTFDTRMNLDWESKISPGRPFSISLGLALGLALGTIAVTSSTGKHLKLTINPHTKKGVRSAIYGRDWKTVPGSLLRRRGHLLHLYLLIYL